MRPKSLAELIPDPQVLLQLPTEHLVYKVLQCCASARQGTNFHPAIVVGSQGLFEARYDGGVAYPRDHSGQLELAAAEAFEWLKVNILVMPAASPNETYFRLTRRGEEALRDELRFVDFARVADFPREMIHSDIREDVWLQVSLSQWSTAVFTAFRAVEVAVRKAGQFAPADHGVPLMRKAFNKDTGPLTDLEAPEAEREAMASLFAGAIGLFKNPHSHRRIDDLDALEARELIMLASHLLRVVDARA